VAPIAVAPEFLSVREARERILAAAEPLAEIELPASESVGRALRETVRAAHALPPFRNSSMDGFAVRASEARSWLSVGETLPAGHAPTHSLAPGEAARIMTGAMLPQGADAVVPYESIETSGAGGVERVRSREPVSREQNVRDAGRDVSASEVALAEGREISPHDLALLVALGVPRVRVGTRPRAAVISTGDELLDVTSPLVAGAIRDSNLPMLVALLAEAGAEVVLARRTGDRPEEVAAAIRDALDRADVVLTIGGVSAGDFDPVKLSLDSLGGVALWRVAMKPGRPQAFGRIGRRLFFGLPGNPASVACVFEVMVRPALRRLQGFAELDRPRIEVRASVEIESRVGRTDYVRAVLRRRQGDWWATPAGEQVSGHLKPQSRAHVLLEIPEAAARLERGESARAILLRWPESSGQPG